MAFTHSDEIRITHIGGPTALIEIGSLRLLTDPAFDPAGTQYIAGPKVITKLTNPALTLAELGTVGAVLLSHDQHNDNLDRAGRAYLPQAGQVLTTLAGAQRLGHNARGLETWETVELSGKDGLRVRITSTPARHGPAEIKEAVGDVSGWILEWEGQQRGALYISGDTVLYDELTEISQRYRIGTALLHFGAASVDVYGPVHLTFTAQEGVRFAEMLGDATIIPIHYEGWAHFTEGQAQIEQAFKAAGREQQLHFLPLGQATFINV
jgi:L-ascorbate metabolism protein UlaG (beta-lactamase superfamily)